MQRKHVVVQITFDKSAIEQVHDPGMDRADDLSMDVEFTSGDISQDISVPSDVEAGAEDVTFEPGVEFDPSGSNEMTAHDARRRDFEHEANA